MFKDIIKTLKINHYIKNLVVVIPLIFSMSFFDFSLCIKTLVVFIAFCFISSSVYIFNDLIDIEKDKRHPVKSNRPIAAGRISILTAVSILFCLIIISSILFYFVQPLCLLMGLLYFILNVFYSLWLKNIFLIDSSCISLGFIIRILAGCYAICVLPSPLVILMTFFVSNFLTFSKRKLELELTKEKNNLRKSLQDVDINSIKQFILMSAVLSVSFYITYVLDSTTIQKTGTQYLYLTVLPFTIIIYRLFLLVNSNKIEDDPIIYFEQDKTLKWLCVIYIFILIIVLTI